jgi:hypothetical protein
MEQQTKPLFPLLVFLQETVAFILGTCTRVNEIKATFSLISRCLRASSRTRRVVNPNFPIQGCLRLTRMRDCGIQTLFLIRISFIS